MHARYTADLCPHADDASSGGAGQPRPARQQHVGILAGEAAPTPMMVYRIAGFLALLVLIGFVVPYGLLSAGGSIDAPAADAFRLFDQQRATVILANYGIALAGILVIPLALLLRDIVGRHAARGMAVGTNCGILAGLTLALGAMRWPFLLPRLADTYRDPHTAEATRAAIAVVYQAVDQYAGIAIGEHLAFLFVAIWTLFLGFGLRRSPIFPAWAGWFGIFVASSQFVSGIEHFDLPGGSVLMTVLIASRIGWGLWLVVLAVVLLRFRPSSAAEVGEWTDRQERSGQ